MSDYCEVDGFRKWLEENGAVQGLSGLGADCIMPPYGPGKPRVMPKNPRDRILRTPVSARMVDKKSGEKFQLCDRCFRYAEKHDFTPKD
ncbi:MAG: hypothetical protein ABSC50_14465 [Candidatus Bathyarchaeia archaeon]|jgi:hypothetical protein